MGGCRMALDIVSTRIPQLQCETDSGIETIPLSEEVSFRSWQSEIPDEYWALESDELVERVRAARAALGDRAVVLGHHYQREDIIQFADERGDSFVLAQYAAERPDSQYIIFCGVHFMAEAADIAKVVAFLCTEEADMIRGQVIVVDGGATLRGDSIGLS